MLNPACLDRVVKIGISMALELWSQIVKVIQRFHIVFAWGPEGMPGIDCDIITHKLAIDPTKKLVQQRNRYLSTNRREFVKKEVTMLLEMKHIKEIYYLEWLNTVVLASKGPTWRMFVDYTDLNETCPMDRFPLPT